MNPFLQRHLWTFPRGGDVKFVNTLRIEMEYHLFAALSWWRLQDYISLGGKIQRFLERSADTLKKSNRSETKVMNSFMSYIVSRGIKLDWREMG